MNAGKKTAKDDRKKLARRIEVNCLMEIHALLDFGKNFERVGISGLTRREAIHNITAKIRRGSASLDGIAAAAPLIRMRMSLDDLDAFMEDASNEDGGGYPVQLSMRGQGRCVYAFALDVARAFDEILEGLGNCGVVGFHNYADHPADQESV